MKSLTYLIALLFLLFAHLPLNSSPLLTDSIQITFVERYAFETPITASYSSYSALMDRNVGGFIYSASAGLGVVVFEVDQDQKIRPVDSIPISEFGGLQAMNLYQHEDYLLVALGSFFGSPQAAGLAILDISNPPDVQVVSQWHDPQFTKGSSVVVTDGQYAYLGAMEDGLLIFNIENKADIQLTAHILPDPDFPEPPAGLSQPKARGLHLSGDLLYLCNDAKGFRIIDVSDKTNPVELSKHMNWELHDQARPAYNEVVVKAHIAYVTVDYCGLEVVDVSDPSNPVSLKWINLWDCNNLLWDNPGSWWDAHGHSNQIVLSGPNHLFMSGGETEVVAFDISDPTNPVIAGIYGEQDHSVAWGIDVYGDHIITANIHQAFPSPPLPYLSDWGGVQLLRWEKPTGLSDPTPEIHKGFHLFPNPVKRGDPITIQPSDWKEGILRIYNSTGTMTGAPIQIAGQDLQFTTDDLPPGFYFYRADSTHRTAAGSFVVH
ncbi:MAG: hypothetical protein EA411_09935 [Saprospirales bacterium]|nr:MAG: hypothetical protein EA411_09935 [Saprospirales bacterium]